MSLPASSVIALSPRNTNLPPTPLPLLSALISLALTVSVPARMTTLPPLLSLTGSLTSSLAPPVMLTEPKRVAVSAAVFVGLTGTSPLPATLVT